MNGSAFSLDLRRSRTLLVWLIVITAAYAGFITVFYTNVAENAAEFEKLLEIYPKELLIAFGIEGNFADPGVFLSGYVFNFLWPLIAAIGAIALATRVATDADRGFLDIVLSTRLPRVRHLLGSIATQIVGIAALALTMVVSILVGDLLIEPNFPTDRVLVAALHAFAFGVAVAGPATLLAVLLLDRGRAAGLVAGVLVIMYLLNVVAALAPDVDWLASVSAFHYFDVKGLIGKGVYPVADSLLLGGIGVACWALALAAFQRRDLAA
jgi:ABC-2 type transport system permease protein